MAVVFYMPMIGDTLADYSPVPKAISVSGGTFQLSSAQQKCGDPTLYASSVLNGCLSTGWEPDFNFGDQYTGVDFTVEFFVKTAFADHSSGECGMFRLYTLNGTTQRDFVGALFLYGAAGGRLYIKFGNVQYDMGNIWNISFASAFRHIAFCRQGARELFFYDGVKKFDSSTLRGTVNYGNVRLEVAYYSTGGQRTFTGYFTDIVVTRGLCKYTENFTPLCHGGAISGTVYEKNELGVYVPGAYPVRAYHRTNGELAGSTTSAANGSYTINGLRTSHEYYLMAVDHSAPIQRAAIVDKATPS